jgi:RNA polymerase sigma-70 factor, ECF subfamily
MTAIAADGEDSRAYRRWPAAAWPGGEEPPMTEADAAADFEAFYATTARRLVRHAYALTGDLDDAHDVAQEAFARAWQRWDSVRDYDSPEAWVRRVATNLATSRYRRSRTARAARHLLPGDLVPEISPDTVALVAALRTLPERQRLVLVLHYLADLPVNQIALELQCPVGSIKAWLSRGRDALAAAMGETAAGSAHRSSPVRPARPEVADA